MPLRLRARFFPIQAAAVLLVLSLVAAGTLAEVVHIEYASTSGAWEDAVIERFNTLYEGRIQVTKINMDTEKLKVAVAGGAAPAVAYVDRFEISSLAAGGFLTPLDDFITRDGVRKEDFFPPAWEEGVFDGRVYGMPRNTDSRAMWYNKTLFEEAGLDSNRPPLTWEALYDYAMKLTRSDANRLTQVGFAPHWGNFGFPGWLWAAGGELLDDTGRVVLWDDPIGIRTLHWMRGWIDTYGRAELDRFASEFQGSSIHNGRLGMELNTVSRWDSLKAVSTWEWGVAYPPRPEGLAETPISWSGGHGLVIPAGSPNAEAGWEFIKFYTGTEGQTLVAQAAPRMPVRLDVATQPEFQNVIPVMSTFVELMVYSRFRPTVPVSAQLYGIYSGEIGSLLLQNVPVEEILSESAKRGQLILDEGWAVYGGES